MSIYHTALCNGCGRTLVSLSISSLKEDLKHLNWITERYSGGSFHFCSQKCNDLVTKKTLEREKEIEKLIQETGL